MKLTKNALLAQWSAKHEYITNEMSQCKHKLELLDKRQKDLMTDLRFAEIYFVASFLLGLFLLYMSKQIFSAFLYFYLPVVALILFFTLGRSIIKLSRIVTLMHYHDRMDLPFQYPRELTAASNYPTCIPPNNYAEQMCLNWLLQKYSMQLQTLQKNQQANKKQHPKLTMKIFQKRFLHFAHMNVSKALNINRNHDFQKAPPPAASTQLTTGAVMLV